MSLNEIADFRNQISIISNKLNEIPLTPDEIDEFVDWIIERWDFGSFYRSSIQFKSRELGKFLNQKHNNNKNQ